MMQIEFALLGADSEQSETMDCARRRGPGNEERAPWPSVPLAHPKQGIAASQRTSLPGKSVAGGHAKTKLQQGFKL